MYRLVERIVSPLPSVVYVIELTIRSLDRLPQSLKLLQPNVHSRPRNSGQQSFQQVSCPFRNISAVVFPGPSRPSSSGASAAEDVER